ncbi:hypothetical protein PSACC_01993 [Paramicrosporidium saccamoebae]|uniref:Uncharacterized protein n=1 Tax=Paramicrosporidium saccamoebae TaxID=1246581 RepID=A0A2H9TKA4_9FUNG|nr:hypothetical protein PSACC_01993 [Paramicrosporidium saccamoebae]
MCHEATILSFRPDKNKTWGTTSPASARFSSDSIGSSLFHGSNINGSRNDAAVGFLKTTRAYNITTRLKLQFGPALPIHQSASPSPYLTILSDSLHVRCALAASKAPVAD